MITITLPWPPSILSPNARAHWSKKNKPRQAAIHDGYYAARVAYTGQPVLAPAYANIAMTMLFYPPRNSHYDVDNLLARSKAAIDGIAKALGVNDKQFRPITVDIAPADKKNQRVEVTLSWSE